MTIRTRRRIHRRSSQSGRRTHLSSQQRQPETHDEQQPSRLPPRNHATAPWRSPTNPAKPASMLPSVVGVVARAERQAGSAGDQTRPSAHPRHARAYLRARGPVNHPRRWHSSPRLLVKHPVQPHAATGLSRGYPPAGAPESGRASAVPHSRPTAAHGGETPARSEITVRVEPLGRLSGPGAPTASRVSVPSRAS